MLGSIFICYECVRAATCSPTSALKMTDTRCWLPLLIILIRTTPASTTGTWSRTGVTWSQGRIRNTDSFTIARQISSATENHCHWQLLIQLDLQNTWYIAAYQKDSEGIHHSQWLHYNLYICTANTQTCSLTPCSRCGPDTPGLWGRPSGGCTDCSWRSAGGWWRWWVSWWLQMSSDTDHSTAATAASESQHQSQNRQELKKQSKKFITDLLKLTILFQ